MQHDNYSLIVLFDMEIHYSPKVISKDNCLVVSLVHLSGQITFPSVVWFMAINLKNYWTNPSVIMTSWSVLPCLQLSTCTQDLLSTFLPSMGLSLSILENSHVLTLVWLFDTWLSLNCRSLGHCWHHCLVTLSFRVIHKVLPVLPCDFQIVLIGDHKQLRPIVKNVRVRKLGIGKSLFERYHMMHKKRAVMLDTQYRMVRTLNTHCIYIFGVYHAYYIVYLLLQ